MDSERYYLIRALSKAEKVVIVKQYNFVLEQTKLVYISPNASAIGLNIDNLRKGYKLLEDYIIPEDRNKVISMFKDNYLAFKSDISVS